MDEYEHDCTFNYSSRVLLNLYKIHDVSGGMSSLYMSILKH